MEMKIVFLDIDGVLNTYKNGDPNGVILQKYIKNLNKITEATKCFYVLSSNWAIMLWQQNPYITIDGFSYMMHTHGAKDFHFIGAVGFDNQEQSKGEHISAFLTKLNELHNIKPISYVVIDDVDDQIVANGHHLIKTNPMLGLTSSCVNKTIEILLNENNDS